MSYQQPRGNSSSSSSGNSGPNSRSGSNTSDNDIDFVKFNQMMGPNPNGGQYPANGGQNAQNSRGQDPPNTLKIGESYTVVTGVKPKNVDTRLDIVRNIRLEANFFSNKSQLDQRKDDQMYISSSKEPQNMERKVVAADPIADFLKESKDHQVCFLGSTSVSKGTGQFNKPWTFEFYMIRTHGANDVDFKVISRNGISDLGQTFSFGDMKLEFLSDGDERTVFERKFVLDLVNGPTGTSGGCARSLNSQEYQTKIVQANTRANTPLLEKFCHVSTFILTKYDLKKCLQICPQGNCKDSNLKIVIDARIQLALYSESPVETLNLPPYNPVFAEIFAHIFNECLMSDVAIKTSNGDQYKVHKNILAAQSDVFERQFSKLDGGQEDNSIELEKHEHNDQHQDQEHGQKQGESGNSSANTEHPITENKPGNPSPNMKNKPPTIIEILNYPPQAVKIFLKFFYFHDVNELNSADEIIVLDVFRLAWRYNFVRLMEIAAGTAGQIQDLGIALKLFVNGCQLDLEPLKNQAVGILKEKGADLKSSKEFQDFIKNEDSNIISELIIRLANSS